MYGLGLNLDPSRFGPPSSVINNIDLTQAEEHFLESGTLAVISLGVNSFAPTQLNLNENAQLAVAKALAQQSVASGKWQVASGKWQKSLRPDSI
jgi:hypothetical protein